MTTRAYRKRASYSLVYFYGGSGGFYVAIREHLSETLRFYWITPGAEPPIWLENGIPDDFTSLEPVATPSVPAIVRAWARAAASALLISMEECHEASPVG